MVARNPSSGAEVWRTSTATDGANPTSGCNSSPAVGADGTVYVACDDGILYALDGTDGSMVWSVEVSNDLSGSSELIKGRSPVVVPGTDRDWIYVTGAGDNLNFVIVDGLTGLADVDWMWNYGEALSSVTVFSDGGFALVWGDGNQQVLDVWGPYLFEWYDNLGVYDPDAWLVGSVHAEFLSSMGFLYVATAEGMLYGYYLPVGLYDGVGAFPKFRSDTGNTGQRF